MRARHVARTGGDTRNTICRRLMKDGLSRSDGFPTPHSDMTMPYTALILGLLVTGALVVHARLVFPHPEPAALSPDGRARLIRHAAPRTADAFRVEQLPGLPASAAGLNQFAGYLTVDPAHGGNLFFWLFEHASADKQPLILWLNGGPGCSSLDGLFKENGPFTINNDLTLSANPASWTALGSVLYVDQPVGTGLSFVSDPAGLARSQADVNRNLVSFLQQFLDVFPHFASRPLFIAGESYAGHYIPALAVELLTHHPRLVNVHGLAIGNGWSHPLLQSRAYAPMAEAAGILSARQRKNIDDLQAACALDPNADAQCTAVAGDGPLRLVTRATGNASTGSINVYDIRLYAPDGGSASWPPGLNNTAAYLALPAVQRAIHTNISQPVAWQECSDVRQHATASDAAARRSSWLTFFIGVFFAGGWLSTERRFLRGRDARVGGVAGHVSHSDIAVQRVV